MWKSSDGLPKDIGSVFLLKCFLKIWRFGLTFQEEAIVPMKEPALTTIFTADNSGEAETVIRSLRTEGLHPADLALTTPIPIEHREKKFPIKVPPAEAERARSIVSGRT